MADLGAEVIKVEQPNGDIFRDTLTAFEPPRKFSTLFENQNCGKYGLQLDLKTEDGVNALKQLLKEADVLLTNIRNESLVGLGIDFESLKEQFPALIHAQVFLLFHCIRATVNLLL